MENLIVGIIILIVAIWYIKEVVKGYREVGILKSNKNRATREYSIDWDNIESPTYNKPSAGTRIQNFYFQIEDSNGLRSGNIWASKEITEDQYKQFIYDKNYNGGTGLELWLKTNCIGEIARQQPVGDFRLRNIQMS